MAFLEAHHEYEFTAEQAVDKIRADRRRNLALAFALGFLALFAFYASIYLAYDSVPEPREPANANLPIGNPTSNWSIQHATIAPLRPWPEDSIEWSGAWQGRRLPQEA